MQGATSQTRGHSSMLRASGSAAMGSAGRPHALSLSTVGAQRPTALSRDHYRPWATEAPYLSAQHGSALSGT